MKLNLLTRKHYYSNGNNKYFCRIRQYSLLATYEIRWEVWCNKRNRYMVVTDSKLWRELEDAYLNLAEIYEVNF